MWTRVLITATLRTETPLHIGDGTVVTRPGLLADTGGRGAEPVEVAAVATALRDRGSAAAIPGSALRGVLRGLLVRVEGREDAPAVLRLFGSQEQAGMLACRDGVCSTPTAPEHPCPSPYWDAFRRTSVLASVALDPVLGTADEGLLRHLEFVPEGETFAVTFALRRQVTRAAPAPVEPDDVARVLALLQALGDGHGQLGANEADGWGRVALDGEPVVHVATPVSVRAWVERGAPGHWGDAAVPLTVDEASDLRARTATCVARFTRAQTCVRAELTLRFSGPLMVSGAHVKQQRDAEVPDTVTLRTPTGRVVLPADSVRGRLRAQALRILRTRLAVDTLDIREGGTTEPEPLEVREARALAEALFGTTGGMSAVRLTPFLPAAGAEPMAYDQQFVALDRFTGGAAPGRLFRWQGVWQPVLHGRVELDVEHFLRRRFPTSPVPSEEERGRALAQAAGLVALVLRDLVEGDIQFGAGRAKGYGWCTATIGDTVFGSATTLPAQVASIASRDATSRANAIARCVDMLPRRADAHTGTPEHPSDDAVGRATPTPLHVAPDQPVAGKFRNPYHFVPLPAGDDDEALRSLRQYALDGGEGTPRDHLLRSPLARHRWRSGTHSGTIACELEIVTPTVIGGERVSLPEGARVLPAREPTPGGDGDPILPGSTARGLVSSVFEAATNSALRVLDDRLLTYRTDIRRFLPYMGVVERTASGWQIMPLCPGPLERGRPSDRDRDLFPEPNLRVSLSGDVVRHLTSADGAPDGGFYGLPIPDLDDWDDVKRVVEGSDPRLVQRYPLHRRDPRVLGRAFAGPAQALRKWDDIPQDERGRYLRGRLLVLRAPERTDLPDTKKHEYFVPWPSRLDTPGRRRVALPDDVLALFHRMADEVYDPEKEGLARRPYEPVGQGRNPDSADGRLRLKPGDLVWFDTQHRRGRYEVTRVALSAIWRSAVGTVEAPGTVHRFFREVDGELLPFNPRRRTVSVAEAVFGFVVDGDTGSVAADRRPVRAYASRVAFSIGRIVRAPADGRGALEAYPVTLRALLSPKPPSPEMYFRPADEAGDKPRARSKEELVPPPAGAGRPRDEDDDVIAEPQGRKFYLHQSPAGEPWVTADAGVDRRLKTDVTPLRPGTAFRFDVRFDGLTARELGLLLFALEPSAAFHHKLGTGRPIGLGTVKIRILGVARHDPGERYSAAGYAAESSSDVPGGWQGLRQGAAALVERAYPDVYRALLLLGQSVGLRDVRTPLVTGQGPRAEAETYQWWVANREARTPLCPIVADDAALPRLPVLRAGAPAPDPSRGPRRGARRR